MTSYIQKQYSYQELTWNSSECGVLLLRFDYEGELGI